MSSHDVIQPENAEALAAELAAVRVQRDSLIRNTMFQREYRNYPERGIAMLAEETGIDPEVIRAALAPKGNLPPEFGPDGKRVEPDPS